MTITISQATENNKIGLFYELVSKLLKICFKQMQQDSAAKLK